MLIDNEDKINVHEIYQKFIILEIRSSSKIKKLGWDFVTMHWILVWQKSTLYTDPSVPVGDQIKFEWHVCMLRLWYA